MRLIGRFGPWRAKSEICLPGCGDVFLSTAKPMTSFPDGVSELKKLPPPARGAALLQGRGMSARRHAV